MTELYWTILAVTALYVALTFVAYLWTLEFEPRFYRDH